MIFVVEFFFINGVFLFIDFKIVCFFIFGGGFEMFFLVCEFFIFLFFGVFIY